MDRISSVYSSFIVYQTFAAMATVVNLNDSNITVYPINSKTKWASSSVTDVTRLTLNMLGVLHLYSNYRFPNYKFSFIRSICDDNTREVDIVRINVKIGEKERSDV